MPDRQTDYPRPRRGAILAIVLVSLLVAAMLGAGLTRTVLIHQQQMSVLTRQQQSYWLAEAAVQRTIRHIDDTSDYAGDTWEVPADVLGDSRTAQVTVTAERHDDQEDLRHIRVAVLLDDDRAQPTGYHREFQYRIQTADSSAQKKEQKAD